MANPKLPRGAIQQLGRLQLRHAENVHAVAWSPRGDRIASVSFDHTLILWDATSGALVHRFGVQDGSVTALGFSPDGARVASGKKSIRVWDCDTGKVALTLKGHKDTVNALDYSPDGATLATACDDHFVRFFDAATGVERDRWKFDDQAMFVRYSPDGRYVLVASEHGTLLHTTDGKRVASAPISGWRDYLKAAFSPDGREVFVVAHDGRALHRLRVPSLETVSTIDLDHGLRTVDVSPDGRWLAFAGFGRYPSSPHPHQIPGRSVYSTHVYLWNIAAWEEVALLRGHVELVQGVAFAPDSERLVSGSGDNTVRVWTIPEGGASLTPGPGFEEEPRGVAFVADGRVVVAASTETLVWNAREGAVLAAARDAGHVQVIARGDRDFLALHWRRPERWTLDGATLTRVWQPDDAPAQLFVLRVSPDGQWAYTGDDTGALQRWRVGERAPTSSRVLFGGKALTALAVSPDGQWIAAGSTHLTEWQLLRADGTGEARAFEIPDRGEKAHYRDHYRQVAALAFSPDGERLYAATLGGNVEVFDAATGHHRACFASRARDTVQGYGTQAGDNLAVSRDGRWIATSYRAMNDHRLMVLSTEDGAEFAAAAGHSGSIDAITLSPDGTLLVTVCGRHREVFVWDVAKLLGAK
jgi:WD40 repeat protein